MDKTAIKNFAVRARTRLKEDIKQKAYELGISDKEIKNIETFEGGFRVKGLENSKIYKSYEIEQRDKLISNINEKGLEQVIEEVAYTWFNRFIALRFMEVNDYLPTGVRVLSSGEEGKTEPDIIGEALEVDLDIDKKIVYRLMDEGDTEDLYKYLIIKQCNQLGSIMPMVFEEISDYTELLLPDRLLTEGSIVKDLVLSIKEEDYKEQVEIIGWMYQYYISEKKDEVFAGLKKNKKITKENIPAATQLFTPKWIVKYMVENSLGRLWLESHPDKELKSTWKYYLEEAEQDPEVQKKLDELKEPNLNPEDIKVLDPAMGSGHILVYAFDVLYDIYLKANYSEKDIPKLILEKNLYGLDIDDRAGQLAAFALMMKARSKNRRIFRRKIDLNICSIQESNTLQDKLLLEYFLGNSEGKKREKLQEDFKYILDVFYDAKEYGSILDVKKVDFELLEKRLEEIEEENTEMFNQGYKNLILENVPTLLKQARIMSGKYDVVCTNPPYMGIRNMNSDLVKYLELNYPDSKNDLFATFIEKGFKFNIANGYNVMVTMQSWMFLSSFSKMRKNITNNKCITTMVHMANMVMGIAFGTVATIFRNKNLLKYKGKYSYVELKDVNSNGDILGFPIINSRYKINNTYSYNELPDSPICYWISESVKDAFIKGKALGSIAKPRQGMATSDNNRFLRRWSEVINSKIGFDLTLSEKVDMSKLKWFPYNKGGNYRKWYGNNEFLVNWENDGQEIKEFASSLYKNYTRTVKNIQFYFKESITWSTLTSGSFSARYSPRGFIFDTKGSSCFSEDKIKLLFILGFMNSKVSTEILEIISPTIDFNAGSISKLPILEQSLYTSKVNIMVEKAIKVCKIDWDSFETSWDFKKHPLLNTFEVNIDKLEDKILLQAQDKLGENENNKEVNKRDGIVSCHSKQSEESYKTIKTIEQAFTNWKSFTESQFQQLKTNEEELNKIFIEIYGLQDELTPEVEDKDITISIADRERDIKSFISYAVGCMFGRYSLDEEGLIYAGGDFKEKFKIEEDELKVNTTGGWKKSSIDVTMDNVLIIADDDYFEDDITNRFIEFVKITFGAETLEENLDYIAETLKRKSNETSRQAIRRYFVKDFYKDHVKTYKKTPIYWEFKSGKQDGFKALIYIHRYDPQTVARVRTDYLHEIQKRYESEINHIDILLDSDLSAREKSTTTKRRQAISKQIEECIIYDQVISHVANQEIEIDLDDGVKVNYQKFQEIEVPQGEGMKPIKADLLTKT